MIPQDATKKYEIAAVITIGTVQLLNSHGVAFVITDGKYVQIEKDK